MPPPDFDAPLPTADQHRFLRRLARGLVRDEHAAEDLVQEAWRSALARQATGAVLGLGWLGSAVRHAALNRIQAERRRRAREEAVARPEAEDLRRSDEELERQTLVLEAVRRLPEELRRVVFLRYYEGLGPKRIATRSAISVATVKSRLARARELLRQDLTRRLGADGRAWLAAVAPLAQLPVPVGPDLGIPGGLLMSTTSKAAVATAAVLGGLFLLREFVLPMARTAETPAVRGADGMPALPEVVVDVTGPPGVSPPQVTQRVASSTSAAADPGSAVVFSVADFHGRVLDAAGWPVSGVEVELQAPAATLGESTWRATTGGDGALSRELLAIARADAGSPWSTAEARLVTEELVTLYHTWSVRRTEPTQAADPMLHTSRAEALWIVAPRRALAGVVVDERGLPLADVDLTVRLPDGFRRRIPIADDLGPPHVPRARSDDAGRFTLADVFSVDGGFLRAERAGYRTRTVSLTEVGPEVRLVLEEPGAGLEGIRGIVLDPAGAPVEGARVSFGGEVARTDAAGGFRLVQRSTDRAYLGLRDRRGAESRTLTAVARGFLPASLQVELDPASGAPRWPDAIVLQLTDRPLAISGRVVDPSGDPLPGTRVFLAEATLFSMADGSSSVENLLGGDPEERITMFPVGEDGSFTIGGLAEREYALVAFDVRTGVQVHTRPVPAGTSGLAIEFDPGRLWRRVEGTVRAPDGRPLAGVEVHVFTDATDFRFEGAFARTSNLRVSGSVSDAEGRFRLTDVPKEHAYLMLMGETIVVTRVDAEPPLGDRDADVVEALELVAFRRARVQVRVEAGLGADEVAFEDAHGAPLELHVHDGKPGPARARMPMHGTITDVLSVPESAAALVLLRAGEVLDRRSVHLDVGRLNEL